MNFKGYKIPVDFDFINEYGKKRGSHDRFLFQISDPDQQDFSTHCCPLTFLHAFLFYIKKIVELKLVTNIHPQVSPGIFLSPVQFSW